MLKNTTIILGLLLVLVVAVKGFDAFMNLNRPGVEGGSTEKFNPLLNEASDMSKSDNRTWWLNSGGKVFIEGNSIKTIQGDLPEDDSWRKKYSESNPTETDNGYHPQNIFRLVTRQKYKNFTQTTHFKVNGYILSDDVHRSASNGVLFFHRYQNGDNLYYAGLRVDGNAVIKKKTKGVYYTMVYQPVFQEPKYDRENNPNLMPINTWVRIRSEIEDLDSKRVSVKLYMDKDGSGTWQLVVEAIDDGKSYGGKAILTEGYGGIRTDFMDVEFEDYKIEEIGGE